MKQAIVSILILSFLFIPASFLRAQTNEDIVASLQEQLFILLKRVLDLQMQLMALLKQQAGEQENTQEILKEQIIQEVEEGIKEEEEQKEREKIEAEEQKEREDIMAELDEIPGYSYNSDLSTEQLKNMLIEAKKWEQEVEQRRIDQCKVKGEGWAWEANECVLKPKPSCLLFGPNGRLFQQGQAVWNGSDWTCNYGSDCIGPACA